MLYAMLTVFQCITMEGWTDIMYNVSSAETTPSLYGWKHMHILVEENHYFCKDGQSTVHR